MKFTGRYTAATAKALKGSPRLVCQVTEDGTIYVCNGFLLCTMNPPEYAATVQGFTCCEPGNWTIDKDGKHEDDAHKLDLVRLYADTLKTNADAQPLQRSPLTVQTPKAAAVCYYNAAADFAAIYDTKFIAALHPAAQLRAASAISAAVAYCDNEPFAVVMPIKAEPKTVRAVRAFFTEADGNNAKTGEADKPGEYVYCYEMQQAPTGCDFAADLSYYGKHYFLRPLRDDLPQLHGRGISYDEERNTYTVTTRAYDKLKEQYRIRYETCLD